MLTQCSVCLTVTHGQQGTDMLQQQAVHYQKEEQVCADNITYLVRTMLRAICDVYSGLK